MHPTADSPLALAHTGAQAQARLAQRLLQWLAFSILGTVFVLPSAAAASFVLLLAVAALVVVSADGRRRFAALFADADERWLAWPFLAWLVAGIVVSLSASAPFHTVLPDNSLRFVIAMCVLALPCRTGLAPAWLYWSLPAAALAAGAHALYGAYWLQVWRVKGWTNNEIYFGNLAALVCVLLVIVALMARAMRWQLRLLFLACAPLAAFASVASGSRSSALALLVLVPVLFMGRKGSLHRRLALVVAASLALATALIAASPALQQKLRITELTADLEQARAQEYGTSLGSRMEMWRAAIDMFEREPLVGVGPKRFAAELEHRMQTGQTALLPRFSQAHSQLLHAAATGGIVLVLGYLGLVAGPLVFFARHLRSAAGDQERRLHAVLGLAVVLAFLLFGLTNAVFDLQVYSMVYPLLLCVLAVLLRPSARAASAAARPRSPAL